MKTFFFVISMIALMTGISANAQADLWLEGGFEGDTGWTAADLFQGQTATNGADPLGARYYDLIGGNMISESGVWIEDATRAYEGNRFFWIRNYADPDTICVGYRFNTLTSGASYKLDWQFAAFDDSNPDGDPTITSKPIVEVMSRNAANTDWLYSEPVLNFGDGQTADPENGNFVEYAVQDWDAISWTSASSTFVAPEANGQPLYIWVSMTSDSNGLLIDGITLTAVPEPASCTLATLALMLISTRRMRRK